MVRERAFVGPRALSICQFSLLLTAALHANVRSDDRSQNCAENRGHDGASTNDSLLVYALRLHMTIRRGMSASRI